MMMSVACEYALFFRPSISPVTVPETLPTVSVNEKSIVSAWLGEAESNAPSAKTTEQDFNMISSL
jgi:hypothetical protein